MTGMFSNNNSFALGDVDDPQMRTLPWLFRAAMPVPVMNVTGI